MYDYSISNRFYQVYRFFAGNPNAQNRDDRRFGIFDYLTLGFHALIEFLFVNVENVLKEAADRNQHLLGCVFGFLTFLVGLVYLPLKLVNMAFGVACTLVTAPITLLAHFTFFCIKFFHKSKNNNNHSITENEDHDQIEFSNKRTPYASWKTNKIPSDRKNSSPLDKNVHNADNYDFDLKNDVEYQDTLKLSEQTHGEANRLNTLYENNF